jgi:exodeoxyribonuclease VII large subunit
MKTNQSLKIEPIVEEKVFSVSEFLDFLNEILVRERVIVQGEIGEKMNNYPRYSFFNLLDKDGSILKCFAWQEVIEALGIEMKPGMEIRVIGYPEIRKNRGELNFQVERIELLGEGVLKRQFEILKKKLEALGYFDVEIKKPIPQFCENIGLITSRVGRGALKDFLTHLGSFGFKIFFYETKVEGSFAVNEISEAINWFNQNMPKLDVLVLIRGGGDWESLKPFNSEEIVKAIFASKIPIITGIGHEDDTTLADLAADLRASTPTAAAKILNKNWELAKVNISKIEIDFNNSLKKIFGIVKEKIIFYRK